MNFLELVTQQYPKQFIPEKQFTFLLEAWNAGQAAEREIYAELIAAAEAVIERWETPLWKESKPTAVAVYRMKDVIERMKEKTND